MLQELDAAFQAEGSVTLAGIEVQLCWNLPLAQLTEDHRRGIGTIGVVPAMMQTHGTGLLVEMEDGVEFDVRPIAETHVGSAALAVGQGVGRSIDDGEVHMARHVVELVNRGVGRCLRTGGKQECKMRTCRHADGTYFLGVEATLLCLAAHHTYGPLTVLPSSFVDGQTFWTRSAIDEVDTLEAKFREALRPKRDKTIVARVVVTAS